MTWLPFNFLTATFHIGDDMAERLTRHGAPKRLTENLRSKSGSNWHDVYSAIGYAANNGDLECSQELSCLLFDLQLPELSQDEEEQKAAYEKRQRDEEN